ncbi:superoxide dismutase family protein [Paenibacillus naphthalenovorans]|uniref:superoxide dismutase family protein n=1 Tax=Paenibacillus naphthalenovorans TaxID=162209 RepID=UPI0010AF3CE2|nr:superoxide dismutase family protein [Paenibacillus naphthalenovorans]GCL70217.1 superoxide dismutase family protein [Paenibacillus naphthalenovorans]
MNFKAYIAAAAIALLLLLVGCQADPRAWFGAGGEPKDQQHEMNDSEAVMAQETKDEVHVQLIGLEGKPIGQARLTQVSEGVRIELESEHLTPGQHGFHVHENGKCEAPDFKSAGGHFNPQGHQHGMGNAQGSHAGDLPNLEANPEGKVKFEYVAKQLTLVRDQPNSLLKSGGTSLIIHEKVDDNRTEPAGNAGARIACGVIR